VNTTAIGCSLSILRYSACNRRSFSVSNLRRRLPRNQNRVVGCSASAKEPLAVTSMAMKRNLLRQRRQFFASKSSVGSRLSKPSETNAIKQNGQPKSDIHIAEERSDSFLIDQLKSFGIGSFAGLLGSLAGMGGGFVMIPLMTAARQSISGSASKSSSWLMALRGGLGLHQHQAHGTSLFAVGTTGLAGALGYGIKMTSDDEKSTETCTKKETGQDDAESSDENIKQMRKGLVELDTAIAIATTAMVTARLGAIASTHLSEKALQRALGAFMVFVAPLIPGKKYLDAWEDVTHLSDPKSQKHLREELARHPEHSHLSKLERLLPASLIGVFSGFLSGMFGVGGGSIVVPSLVLFTDMTQHSALGTSLCAMVLPALVGTYTHAKRGNVAWRVAPMLALGSFIGAFFGGRDVGMHMEEDVLRGGFACLMLVLGVKSWRKGGR